MKKGKTNRRLLALVLCLAMLFSCVPQGAIPVFAAGDDTASQGQPDTGETPTDPEVTTEPTEPEDTTAPTEPEVTTEPTEPEDTTAPTEPEVTTEPTQPEDTTAPTEPGVTTEPTEPEDTTAPTEPEVDTGSNAAPQGEVQSGTAGENVTWTLTEDGLLTISGEGPMKDYAYSVTNVAPWKDLGVTRVVVEEGVTSVGAFAFYEVATLEKVTLPPSLTVIGNEAFKGSGLVQVTIPDSVERIDAGAFKWSDSLISVTLPNRRLTLGDSIFDSCDNLTEVIMPADFTAIGSRMFSYCENLTTLDLSHVTFIGEEAFAHSGIEKADLSSLVTMETGGEFYGAFYNCSNLRSVTFGNQLNQISGFSFRGCVSLKEITIPGNVHTIGESAFWDCTALQRVVLEEGVASIAENAFCGASALEEITFPASLSQVKADALRGCYRLQTVKLTSQGENSFAGLIAPQNIGASFNVAVTDGGSLSGEAVVSLASEGAVGLRVNPGETVVLQDALQVGTWSMPLGALSAGTYTADTAGNLYRLSDNAAVLAYCASGEESLVVPASVICHEISYPVTAVGGYAFAGCGSLTTLTFEDLAAIESLEDYAFANSKLTTINEKSKAEEILQTFPKETSLGVELFWNSPLGTASEPGPATGEIAVAQNGLRVTLGTTAGRPDDTDGTKLCWTGQSASITIRADGTLATGSAEQQIVLYFRFADPQGGFDGNYEMDKDYTIPGRYTMRISRASVSGGYFVVLQQPTAGGTYTFSLPVSYPSGSAGGTLFVSAAITEKDAPLKIPALTDGKFHAVRWDTQRNEYTVSQTANWNYTLLGDGVSEGTYLNSNRKTYTVKFTRSISAPEGNYGQDLRTYIDFTCRFKLPKGVQAAMWLQEAIQNNNYRAQFFQGIEVLKSDGTSVFIYIKNSQNQDGFVAMPQMRMEEDSEGVQTLVIAWRSYNVVSEGGKDVFDNGFTIQLPQYMFYISDVDFYNEQNPNGGKVVSTLSAATHYQFSSPLETVSAACNQSVPLGKTELTFTNSLSNTSEGGMGLLFAISQSLELKNTGATSYDIGGWKLKEQVPSPFYVDQEGSRYALDNLFEAASKDARYDLEVIIRSSTLYKPIESQTYLDTSGRDLFTTSLANAAYYTDYNMDLVRPENNAANIVADNVQVAIRSGVGVYQLTVRSASGTPIAGIPDREVKPGELNQALAEIGYTVTGPAAYEVIWHISEDCVLHSGESISMSPSLKGKNTFEYTQQDLLNSYDDFDATAYTFEPITAYLYDENNEIWQTKKAGKTTRYTPEIRLDNQVTALDDDSDINNLKEGNILQYRARISYSDRDGFYQGVPLIQRSTGAQVLLASVADNPNAAWAKGLDTVTLEDGAYYVLDRSGTYEGVWIDGEYVAVVTVSEDESGWDTLLKRYYPRSIPLLSGNPVGTYKTMVKLPEMQADAKEETQFFYLRGQAWLNDSPTHRLFAGTAPIPVAAFELEKEIVSGPEDTGAGAEHSAIQAGDTVYYRLSFWKKYADIAVTITGEDIKDSLPLALADSGIAWSKNNIQITTTTPEAVKNLDHWEITQAPGNPNQQYIVWDADFSMELSVDTPVTLYVALTFPSGKDWEAYAEAYASRTLSNTIEVSGIRDSVYQDVLIGGAARLQKGVYANGHIREDITTTYIQHLKNPAESARLYYENDSAFQNIVMYYVTLYNEGPTKLYLTELQDTLPEGFTAAGMFSSGKYDTAYCDKKELDIGYSWGASSGGAPLATVQGVEQSQYRKVFIRYTVDEETGNLKFTFTRDDNSDISYDENAGLCYLKPGEAIVFGYFCRTNDREDTENMAVNTIAMPCYDYNGGGLRLAQNAPSVIANHTNGKPVTESPDGLTNDGTMELIASEDMDSQFYYPAGTSQWLVSSVTSQRDEILPGIKKSLINPSNGIAGPAQELNWQLTAYNDGHQPIYGYVITDQIQSPYRFEGDITFTADGEIPWTDSITLLRDAQNSKQVTVIGVNGEKLPLTVDGDPVSLVMEFEDSNRKVNLRVPLKIHIATAKDGGEVLSLYFEPAKAGEEKIQALMPGQTLNIELSTKPYTTDLRNKVFLNQAYITPTTQTWSEPVNYGNLTSMVTPFTGAEERLSVRNSAQVITTTGLATTSSKEVTQGGSTAVSTANENWMLLSDPDGTFTYTLKVTNVSQTQIAKMVLIDNLPEPDDHSTFIEGDPRYSEFKVSLADDPQIQVKIISKDGSERILTPVADYTVGYSSKTTFTEDDWRGTTQWNDTSEASTRSLRVKITCEIPADSTVSVTFAAKIDGDSHAGQTAWNSFGYAYQVDKSWLEAAPLKVGVRLKAAPALVKELQTSTGDAFVAETDQTFTFMLYEGEALTLPENFTEETLKALLAEKNRSYTTVSLTVEQGQSITEPYILENCMDETGAPWVWEANQKYTLVELPGTTGMHYVSTNNRMQPSYTFTYNEDQNQRLRVVNAPNTWSILLHKTDSSQKLNLSGAWFAFYSPNEKDQISDEAYNALKPEHREKAAETLEKDGTTYYLMSVLETDASGNIEWRDLREESYLYLEIQAPEGYSIRDEEATKVTWPAPQEDGAVVTCTVINNTHYALPKTGGMGRWQIPALGLVLCAAVVTVFLGKRRKKAA